MRAELGPIALIAGYCFAGFGVLSALQFVRFGIGSMVAALGLSFMVGVATVLLVDIALLCVGIPVEIETMSVVAVLIGGGGLVVAFWQGEKSQPGATRQVLGRSRVSTRCFRDTIRTIRRAKAEYWLAIGVIAALAVFAVLTYRWALVQPVEAWDSWSIWARKGTLLYDYSSLPTAFFTSPVYTFMHPDYPLLVPLYEASWFRAVASPNTQSLHAWFWVLFVAFLWATGYVASRVARPAIWAPLIGLLAVTPAIWSQLMTMYADIPMGLFLLVGVLLLGLWIADRRGRDLALAVILLGAAASTKNEGLTAGISALVIALIITLVVPAPRLTRRRALAPLIAGITVYATMIAPWRLWLAFHHITGEMPVGHGLDPSFLIRHANRIPPTGSALFSEVTNQGNWYYLLPISLALMVAGLSMPGLRKIAAFYALAMAGAIVMMLWAYVISPDEIHWLIATSSNRTVVGPMLIAVAGTFHLGGMLSTRLIQHPKLNTATRHVPTT